MLLYWHDKLTFIVPDVNTTSGTAPHVNSHLFDESEQQFLEQFLNSCLGADFRSAGDGMIMNNNNSLMLDASSSFDDSFIVVPTKSRGIPFYGVEPSALNHSIHNNLTPASNLIPTVSAVARPHSELVLMPPASASAPGTVPAPVLAPRKKRHRSNERLTEEEKRANHIASEQKRRHNIRMGFQALSLLVPSLKDVGAGILTNNNLLGCDRSEFVGDAVASKMRKISPACSRTVGSFTGAVPSKHQILSEGNIITQRFFRRFD